MQILPFSTKYLDAAANLFVNQFQVQRQAVPILPETFASPGLVFDRLDSFFKANPGLAALEDGRLVGYLGWLTVDRFRDTERRGAYCPIWAHAVGEGSAARIYGALYQQAAGQWASAGCEVHAISLLADDRPAQEAWFWNGFGLTVVDAIRSTRSLGVSQPPGAILRKATPDDTVLIAEIEVEHRTYYTGPPLFMALYPPVGAEEYAEFIRAPSKSVWLAFAGTELAGYMRFEPSGEGATEIVRSPTTIANTGAFVRPRFRGRGLGASLLDAALRDYGSQGFTCCSVDFESFNPEAIRFWMKYFTPVSLSLTRRPESF